MRLLSHFLIGLIFGIGISISGMANPAKVINFFDVAGTWDPSLIFVMGGGLIVTFFGYRFVLKRPKPAFEDSFHVPSARQIDGRLLGGSALFGIGWGISGFCPGGVIPVIGTGKSEVLIFMVAMVGGVMIARFIQFRTS